MVGVTSFLARTLDYLLYIVTSSQQTLVQNTEQFICITTDYKSLNGILYSQLHCYDSTTLHLTIVMGLLEIHGCYRNFAFDCYWIVINTLCYKYMRVLYMVVLPV